MPENPDFGTFGRYQELLVEEMSPSQKKAYEYDVPSSATGLER